MTGYVPRRVAGAMFVLLALSVVVYGLFSLSPGDPAVLACGKICAPDRLALVRHQLGLDQPVPLRYWHFLQGLVVGRDYSAGPSVSHCPAPCLGYSFRTDQPVTALLADRLPVSASLAAGGELLSLLVGVGAGVLSALRRGRVSERLLSAFTLAGFATPVFLIGLALILLFCASLQWLPFPSYIPLREDPLGWASNLALPWVTLALAQAATYARISRTGLLETLAEDHIRTARAYGLTERAIIVRHALRGALTPLVSLAAIDTAAILTSAVITENLFGLPGVGQLLVQSVRSTDLPVVVGLTLLAGLAVVLASTVADLLYAVIDPRTTVR